MTAFVRNLPFGASLLAKDRTRFRLWAPAQASVSVEIDGKLSAMRRVPDGWFEAEARCGARPGLARAGGRCAWTEPRRRSRGLSLASSGMARATVARDGAVRVARRH